jgi:cold shock CspA family protein
MFNALRTIAMRTAAPIAARRWIHTTTTVCRETGELKFFNADKGFGFVAQDGREDVFLHATGIRGAEYGLQQRMPDGTAVEFEFGEDNRGRAQATDLTLAGGEEVVAVEASAHPGKRVREGDWTCPSCQASCFASRFECYRCGAAKPQ